MVLETNNISLADSQEAKNTSNHSDTSTISGDECKDATKENVIDPKHDAQEAKKCVTTSEAIRTSIDTNENLKNDMQLADSCLSNIDVLHIVKETDECTKLNTQPPENFVVTKDSLIEEIPQTYCDNFKHITQTQENCEATTKSVQCSKESDANPEGNTQTCNGAIATVKLSEENINPPKDNGDLSSEEKIDLSSDVDKASQSEGSELQLSILLSDDEIELLEDMRDIERLKLYDAVNKIKNFVYQAKLGDTIVDIVINSVALMRSLKLRDKLTDNEVEDVEELVRQISLEKK